MNGNVASGRGIILDQAMLKCMFEFLTSKTLVIIVPTVCKAWSGAVLVFSPEKLDFSYEPPWGRRLSDQALLRCVIPRIGQSVRSVYLSNCGGVSDSGLHIVAAAFPHLRVLEVRHCRQISHMGLMRVTSLCRQLEKLHLPTYVSDADLLAISVSSPSLVEVDASASKLGRPGSVTDAGVVELVRVSSNLQSLNLTYQKRLTAVSLQAIGQHCPNLTKLNLSSTGMSALPNDINTGISSLQQCGKLAVLNLCSLSTLSDSSLQVISSSCPLLQELQLLKCVEITDTGLSYLSVDCHMIRKIGLDFLSKITDDGLRSLALGCPQMQVIELPSQTSSPRSTISETGVVAMLRMCGSLHLDNVCGGVVKSDTVVAEFAMVHPELKTLKRDIRLSDEGLIRLSAACPLLQEVSITSCNISDCALAELGDRCPLLQRIQLMHCQRISERSIVHLLECCTNLQPQGIFIDDNIVGDRYMQALGIQRPHIRSIFVASNIVTDEGVQMLSNGCVELETVCLCSCDRISDVGLAHLVSKARRIRRLSLALHQITDFSLGIMAVSCGELEELALYINVDGICKDGLQMLVQTVKRLRNLYLRGSQVHAFYISLNDLQLRIPELKLHLGSPGWAERDSFPQYEIDSIAEF